MIEISKQQILNAMEVSSSQNALAKNLGVSKPTLVKFLTLYDLPTNLKRDNSKTYLLSKKITREWLIENYVNTPKSLHDIESEMGLKPRELEKLCLYYQLKKPYKYNFNSEKFYNLQDPAIYYVAGLCATDGYVDADVNRISIGLNNGNSEFELLNSIKNYYGFKQPIEVYKTSDEKSVCQLTISDSQIRSFLLENFNIPSGSKTWTVGVPTYFYNEDCIKAYVLGCIDGDGCITISNNKPSVKLLSASENFVTGLSEIIYTSTMIDMHFHSYKKYFTLENDKIGDVVNLLDWLYSYKIFWLDRKYKRYLKVKDIVCSTK